MEGKKKIVVVKETGKEYSYTYSCSEQVIAIRIKQESSEVNAINSKNSLCLLSSFLNILICYMIDYASFIFDYILCYKLIIMSC